MIVAIDTETDRTRIPAVATHVCRNVGPPANYKKPESIAKWWATEGLAARQKAVNATALSAMFGTLAVVVLQPLGGTMRVFCIDDFGGSERDMLASLVDCVRDIIKADNGRPPRWLGFNSLSFDQMFLYQRCLIQRVKAPFSWGQDAKPWSDKHLDLRLILSGGDRHAPGTLQDWCVAFGKEPRANDIPGHEVPDAIEAGRMDEVVEHCRQDVRDCVFLWECINGGGNER